MVDQTRADKTGEATANVTTPADHPEMGGGGGSEDFSALTVEELQDRLRAADQPVSGNKDELVERLSNSPAVKGYPATGSNPFNDFKRRD